MADKRKKRGGVLGRLVGIGDPEPEETDEDIARKKRYKRNIEEWRVLRLDLDAAMRSYLVTGSTQKWDDFCSESVVEGQKEAARPYRQAGVRWAFPGRDQKGKNRGNDQVRVSRERTGGANGREQKAFEITETFNDFSQILDDKNQPILIGNGEQRVLIARIIRRPDGRLFIDEMSQG
jgi:hypothetical protein